MNSLQNKLPTNFFSKFKRTYGLVILLVLAVAIPITLGMVKQQQTLRQEAAGGATCSFNAYQVKQIDHGVTTDNNIVAFVTNIGGENTGYDKIRWRLINAETGSTLKDEHTGIQSSLSTEHRYSNLDSGKYRVLAELYPSAGGKSAVLCGEKTVTISIVCDTTVKPTAGSACAQANGFCYVTNVTCQNPGYQKTTLAGCGTNVCYTSTTTTSKPTTPSGVKATTSTTCGGKVVVTWTAVNPAPNSGYDIHRGTSNDFTVSTTNKIGNTSGIQYTDTVPSASTTTSKYYYRVVARSKDSTGNIVYSDPSNIVNASPSAACSGGGSDTTTAPSTPTGVVATTGSACGGKIVVSWNASNPVPNRAYYIYRSVATNPSFAPSEGNNIGNTTATTYTDTVVDLQQKYIYKIIAHSKGASNQDFNSEPSANSNAAEPSVSCSGGGGSVGGSTGGRGGGGGGSPQTSPSPSVVATGSGEISGRAFLDVNKDRVYTPNKTGVYEEKGIPGVKITLKQRLGAISKTVTTSSTGQYTISNLPVGTYDMRVSEATCYLTGGGPGSVVVSSTTPKVTANFPLEVDLRCNGTGSPPDQTQNIYTVSGIVFVDTDNDGVRDTGESGRSSVTLRIEKSGMVTKSTTSNAAGGYEFEGLASGTYSVTVVPPSGYTVSGGKSASRNAAVSSNTPDFKLDFGIKQNSSTNPSTTAPACGSTCTADSSCAGAANGCTQCKASIVGGQTVKKCERPSTTTLTCNSSCASDNDCAAAGEGCTACKTGTDGKKSCQKPTSTPACGSICTDSSSCAGAANNCSTCVTGSNGAKTCQSSTNGNKVNVIVNVTMPGIGSGNGDNNTPNHPTRSGNVYIFDSSNQQKSSSVVNFTYAGGKYTGKAELDIPEGIYYVKVKFDNTLQKLVPGVQNLKKGDNNLATVALVPGNLNTNNVLDISDYNIFINCIDEEQCNEKTLTDFNDDGEVELIDYNIILRSFAIRDGD